MKIPGKNEPCPCGSGRKLKHCCKDIDTATKKGKSELERADELLHLRSILLDEKSKDLETLGPPLINLLLASGHTVTREQIPGALLVLGGLSGFMAAAVQRLKTRFRRGGMDQMNFATTQLLADYIKSSRSDVTVKIFDLGKYLASTPPRLRAEHCKRSAVVTELCAIISKYPCLFIHGEIDLGKTTLAMLVAEHLELEPIFIDFNQIQAIIDLSKFPINPILASCLNQMTNISGAPTLDQVVHSIEPKQIIIVDGLPRFASNDLLFSQLQQFISLCLKRGLTLIATSVYPLDQEFLRLFADNEIFGIKAPSFTRDDIIELLAIYNAPQEFSLGSWPDLFGSFTDHHPVFLISLFQFLRSNNWQIDFDSFNVMMKKDYAKDLYDKAQIVLAQTLSEAERELLYRVGEVIYQFSIEDVLLLANTPPQIKNPGEMVSRLRDLWIRPINGNLFSLSPLIKPLGAKNLPPELVRNLNHNLGLNILSKKQLGPLEAMAAIAHFGKAENYDLMAIVIEKVLISVENVQDVKDDFGLIEFVLSLWQNVNLPNSMMLPSKIMIRALQVRCLSFYKRDLSFHVKDLLILMKQADETISYSVWGGCIICFLSEGVGFADKCAALKISLPYFDKAKEQFSLVPDEESDSRPFDMSRFILPILGGLIKNHDDAAHWIDLLESLEPDHILKSFADEEIAYDACRVAANMIAAIEAIKPEQQRDWSRALHLLDRLEKVAKDANIEILLASTVSAKILLYAEYQRNLARAIQIAEGNKELLNCAPAKVLVGKAIGQQLVLAKQIEKGMEWLKLVVENPLPFPTEEYATAKIYYACGLDMANIHDAITNLLESIEMLKDLQMTNSWLIAKPYGELAIAYLLKEDAEYAFAHLYAAVLVMLDSAIYDDLHKDQWIALVSMACYFDWSIGNGDFSQFIRPEGKPPEIIERGFLLPYRSREHSFSMNAVFVTLSALFSIANKLNKSDEKNALVLKIKELENANPIPKPDFPIYKYFMINCYSREGMFERAVEEGLLLAIQIAEFRNMQMENVISLGFSNFTLFPIYNKLLEDYLANMPENSFAEIITTLRKSLLGHEQNPAIILYFDLLERTFIIGESGYKLKAFGDSNAKATPLLSIMSYCGASLRPEMTAENVAKMQIGTTVILEGWFSKEGILLRSFANLIRKYWANEFFQKRPFFSTPDLTQTEFELVLKSRHIDIWAILSVLARGLSIDIEKIRDSIKKSGWLPSHPTGP